MRASMHVPELEEAASPSLRVRNPSWEQRKRKKKTSKNSLKIALFCLPYIERCKGTKKGTFLPTMKGLKGTKMRVNTHVPGVKPAKSSFKMVRNPSRVERERKKKFECPNKKKNNNRFLAPCEFWILNSHWQTYTPKCRGVVEEFFSRGPLRLENTLAKTLLPTTLPPSHTYIYRERATEGTGFGFGGCGQRGPSNK